MAIALRSWHSAPSLRLTACLAGSALLHGGSVMLLAMEWPQAAQRPDTPPKLEAQLMKPPPEAAAPLRSEPLIKDTLSDVTVQPATDAAPLRAASAGAARARTSDGARERAAQRKLAEHLFYPPEAVAAAIEGEVRLLLTLDPAGNVLEAVVASSSGHAVLDRAALEAARSMGSLPGAGRREIILPVVFRLE